MTVVALALVVALVLVVLAFTAILARQQRAHARREDLLLNQLLHAAGKTWTPPPTREHGEPLPLRAVDRWTPTPEQLPVS